MPRSRKDPGRKATPLEIIQRTAASRVGVARRKARVPYGKRMPKLTDEQILAVRMKLAADNVESAKLILREASAQAARILARAMTDRMKGSNAETRKRAAEAVLDRSGVPAKTVSEIQGMAPVVVNLGDMDQYPKPDADMDGQVPGGES